MAGASRDHAAQPGAEVAAAGNRALVSNRMVAASPERAASPGSVVAQEAGRTVLGDRPAADTRSVAGTREPAGSPVGDRSAGGTPVAVAERGGSWQADTRGEAGNHSQWADNREADNQAEDSL
jgi:hypothetical protein